MFQNQDLKKSTGVSQVVFLRIEDPIAITFLCFIFHIGIFPFRALFRGLLICRVKKVEECGVVLWVLAWISSGKLESTAGRGLIGHKTSTKY